MLVLTRPFQVLLDEDRYRRLKGEALTRQLRIAVLVRDAIDRALAVHR